MKRGRVHIIRGKPDPLIDFFYFLELSSHLKSPPSNWKNEIPSNGLEKTTTTLEFVHIAPLKSLLPPTFHFAPLSLPLSLSAPPIHGHCHKNAAVSRIFSSRHTCSPHFLKISETQLSFLQTTSNKHQQTLSSVKFSPVRKCSVSPVHKVLSFSFNWRNWNHWNPRGNSGTPNWGTLSNVY